jgi:hypothetical protein
MRSDFPLAASLRRSPGSGRVATGRVAASCRTSGVRRRRRWQRRAAVDRPRSRDPSFGYVRSKGVNDENASHGALHQGELLSPVLGVRKPQPEVQAIFRGLRSDTSLESATERLDATRILFEKVKQDRELFLGELFTGDPNPIELMKKKELHDLLDDALERLDAVTLTLASVLLKNG